MAIINGRGRVGARPSSGGGTPTPSYLLDTYSGAAVAYSLRKLSSTYSGNCIRVRRSSDNAEQNIGFVSNVLDTASLLSFVGAGNGFITIWYDQSGNGKNLIQTTASYQPKIISSGSIYQVNSKPAIYNNNINGRLIETTLNISQPISTFIVNKADNKGFSLILDAYNSSNRHYISRGFSLNGLGADNGGVALGFNSLDTNQNLIYTLSNSTNSKTSLNSTSENIGNAGINGLNGISLFDIRGTTPVAPNTYNYYGYIQELIIYPINQNTNKSAMETLINTNYGIY